MKALYYFILMTFLLSSCSFYVSYTQVQLDREIGTSYKEIIVDSTQMFCYKRFTWADSLESRPSQRFGSTRRSFSNRNPRYIVDVQALIFFPKDSVVLYLPSVGYKYLCHWAQNTPMPNYDLDDVRHIYIGKFRTYYRSTDTITTVSFFNLSSKANLLWKFKGIPGKIPNAYASTININTISPNYNRLDLMSVEHIDERSRDKITIPLDSVVFFNSKGAKITQSNPECSCEDLELTQDSKIRYTLVNWVKSNMGNKPLVSFEMKNITTNDPKDTRWNTFTNRVIALPDK